MRIARKFIAIILTTAIGLAQMAVMPEKIHASTTGTVTLSVEKFTIGQGFVVEPIQVEITNGSTVSSVFEEVMKSKGIGYVNEGGSSFYLTSIKNADSGVINIPEEISAMEAYNQYWISSDSYVYAPSNKANDGNESYPALGTYSYNSLAGWLFTVNGQSIQDTATAVTVKGGDVIRCQFSVYGYGADLGIGYGTPTNLTIANKEELISTIAEANNQKYLSDKVFFELYKKAIECVSSYKSSENELKLMNDVLKSAMKALPPKQTVTEKPTEVVTTEYDKLAKGSVKSLKNAKGKKAKLVIKKIKGATGYQIKYSKYKSFRDKKIVNTKKVKYTIKKLKKKNTYYVKVRAYKVLNKNVYVYGKWSKRKSVKITK